MSSLAKLLEHPALWRGNALAPVRSASLPTGFPRLDRELPGGGWPTGALTEILVPGHGMGEVSLLLPVLARLSQAGRWQTWIGTPHTPYPPALAAAGIDLARLIVVAPPDGNRPGRPAGAGAGSNRHRHSDSSRKPCPEERTGPQRDTLWSIEQTLRANVCGAVLAWLPASRPPVSYTHLRRLQLAAESSEVLVVLFRPAAAAREASPAALRLVLEPLDRGRLAVHLLKRRGLAADAPVHLDLQRPHAMDRHHPAATPARGVPAGESVN